MRKILILLLTIILVCSCTACQFIEMVTPKPSPTLEPTAIPTAEPTIPPFTGSPMSEIFTLDNGIQVTLKEVSASEPMTFTLGITEQTVYQYVRLIFTMELYNPTSETQEFNAKSVRCIFPDETETSEIPVFGSLTSFFSSSVFTPEVIKLSPQVKMSHQRAFAVETNWTEVVLTMDKYAWKISKDEIVQPDSNKDAEFMNGSETMPDTIVAEQPLNVVYKGFNCISPGYVAFKFLLTNPTENAIHLDEQAIDVIGYVDANPVYPIVFPEVIQQVDISPSIFAYDSNLVIEPGQSVEVAYLFTIDDAQPEKIGMQMSGWMGEWTVWSYWNTCGLTD